MPVELSSLIYFVALIDAGSVSGVSEGLQVSSSTVNHAVSSLEHGTAQPLLARTRGHRSMTTTAYGETVYQSATALLQWCGRMIEDEYTDDQAAQRPAIKMEDLRALLQSSLTLRMIGYFLTICEMGGIARASRALSITQPSLSRQIRKLESILKRQLFERSSGGVTLTPAAMALRKGCQEADATYRRMTREENFSYFREFRTLRLASMMPSSSDSSLTILLANLVRLWRDRRYQPHLFISTIPAPGMVDGLLHGQYDVGLSDLLAIPPSLDHGVLETSDLYLVHASNMIQSSGPIPQDVIEAGTLAVPAFGTGLRRLTDQFLEGEGIVPHSILETQSLSLMLRLVEDGTCCAIMPAGSFRPQNVRAVVLPQRYRMTTRLLWKRDHANLASIKRLRDAIEEIQAARQRPAFGQRRRTAA